MDLDDIQKIVKILKQSDINEFELEQDGVKIRLTRGGIVRNSPQTNQQIAIEAAFPGAPFEGGANEISSTHGGNGSNKPIESDKNIQVKSPIVGTFYRKPSPDAEPFAKEGKEVKKGDTLCIVEAMKLMNEIEAPISGRIVKVHLSEGQVVEFGEVLFTIEPA